MNEVNDTQQISNDTPKEKIFNQDILRFIIIVLVVILPIRLFVIQPFLVSGASMDPTFADGQYLMVDELTYYFEDPARGDVVIFKSPFDKRYIIKRVIGLPLETIEINKGAVTIKNPSHPQGLELQEPYVEPARNFTEGHIVRTLKAGEYFVMGDNRKESLDSRIWGPLDRDKIIGRPLLRLFPITSVAVLPGDYTY